MDITTHVSQIGHAYLVHMDSHKLLNNNLKIWTLNHRHLSRDQKSLISKVSSHDMWLGNESKVIINKKDV